MSMATKSGRPVTSARYDCNQFPSARLITRVADVSRILHRLDYIVQVVARRCLQCWEFPIRLEFLQPQQLPDGQQVPVIDERGARGGQCTAEGCAPV